MKRVILLAACVASMSASMAMAAGRGELVALSQLPPAVFGSVRNAAQDVKWIVSFRFPADATMGVWYRVAGRDEKQNRLIKVMVQENGEIIDVRTEIPFTEVPAVVNTGVRNHFGQFQPKSVEAVGKTSKSTVYYRFEGELDGVQCAILARHDGARVVKE